MNVQVQCAFYKFCLCHGLLLQGRIVVITGSAQGLGKAFARKLLNAGAKVCISDIHLKEGNKTLCEFQEIYGAANVHFIQYIR